MEKEEFKISPGDPFYEMAKTLNIEDNQRHTIDNNVANESSEATKESNADSKPKHVVTLSSKTQKKKSKKSVKKSAGKNTDNKDAQWHSGYFAGLKRFSFFLEPQYADLLRYVCDQKGKSIHSLMSQIARDFLDDYIEQYILDSRRNIDLFIENE
ncbi:MAG: hypothetical protein IJ623_07845 [Bacteroidales bacterium]|nr:hypothetical protein [Bacteroidales bacterium]